jgi:hypothetical protein
MMDKMHQVKFDGQCVTVGEEGWTPLLKIYEIDTIANGKVEKQLSVGISAVLIGTFDEQEAQAKAYVEAFELARKVFKQD